MSTVWVKKRLLKKHKNFKHYNIDIRLRSDIIPHPKALLVNRLSIDQLSVGKNEYDAFKEIH